jgi:hypothetical protein
MFRLLLLIPFLSACAGSPYAISNYGPENLAIVSDDRLCVAFYYRPNENLLNEIKRRNILTPRELSSVQKKSIFVGMSKTALLCSWGEVPIYGSTHKRYSKYGESTQYVYQKCSICNSTHVFVEKGKVTYISS